MSDPVLDPHTKALLDQIATQTPQIPFSAIPIAESRAALKRLWLALDRDPIPVARTDHVEIAGPHGRVPLWITWPTVPSASALSPIGIFIHGGGFCRGDAEAYDNQCRYFTREADCIIINVEYRLAPEHPFPQGLEDCIAAYRWALENAASLGGDAHRIAVFGDSAGANFSAVIAMIARDEGLPLAWQGLVYPGVDLRRTDAYPSRAAFDGGYFFLDTDRLYWYFDAYLGNAENGADWRASPILAPSFSGLAPALVVTAECDLLRDEGAAYATALSAAGVATEYRCFPGTVHGVMSFTKAVPLALEVQGLVAARLRAHVHPPQMGR